MNIAIVGKTSYGRRFDGQKHIRALGDGRKTGLPTFCRSDGAGGLAILYHGAKMQVLS